MVVDDLSTTMISMPGWLVIRIPFVQSARDIPKATCRSSTQKENLNAGSQGSFQ